MIDLEKYYGNLNKQKLIEIIDSPLKYKESVIRFCEIKLNKKQVDKSEIKKIAIEFHKTIFYKYFTDGDYLNNKSIDIKSKFLDEKEMKQCFLESKYEYTKYIEAATNNLPS